MSVIFPTVRVDSANYRRHCRKNIKRREAIKFNTTRKFAAVSTDNKLNPNNPERRFRTKMSFLRPRRVEAIAEAE